MVYENSVEEKLRNLENKYKKDILKLRNQLLDMKESFHNLSTVKQLTNDLKKSKDLLTKQKEYYSTIVTKQDDEIKWLKKELEILRNKNDK